MTLTPIANNPIVRARKDVAACDLGGEMAILQLETGIYFGLNTVGTRIWSLIGEGKRVAEIVDALLEVYEVERELLEADVKELLGEMQARSLIEVSDAPLG